MFISCAVDEDSVAGVLTYLNRPDIMNVAITRARDLQYLYLSRSIETIPESNLFGEYLRFIQNIQIKESTYSDVRGKYISDLAEALVKTNLTVLQNFPIAGINMDLVAVLNNKCLVIDLIGFPVEFEDVLHISRYKIFERAGLRIFPLSLIEWIDNRDTVLKTIKTILVNLDSSSLILNKKNKAEDIMLKLNLNNNALAVKIKQTEHQMSELELHDCTDALNEMLASYNEFLKAISERFAVDSLTYDRYVNAVNNLINNIIENFKKIIILVKCMPFAKDLTSEFKNLSEDHLNIIKDLKILNKQGITKIKELSLNIRHTLLKNKDENDFKSSLDELEILNTRIGIYSKD